MGLKGEIQNEMETNSGEAEGHHVIKSGKTMEEKIKDQPKLLMTSAGHSSCCIFRVFRNFINTNGTKAYQPEIVSIGPYHHRKSHDSHLQMLEEHKWRYLGSLVSRTEANGVGLANYREAIQSQELYARHCYSETIDLTSEEFVEMMVLDGCFIIELFRKKEKVVHNIEEDDPIFSMSWLRSCLARDLLKLENQIPWFILQSLFNKSKIPEDTEASLAILAFNFFRRKIAMLGKLVESNNDELAIHISAGAYDGRSASPTVGRVRSHTALKMGCPGDKTVIPTHRELRLGGCLGDETVIPAQRVLKSGGCLGDELESGLGDELESGGCLGDETDASSDKAPKHHLYLIDKCPKHLLDFIRSSFIPDHQEPPGCPGDEALKMGCPGDETVIPAHLIPAHREMGCRPGDETVKTVIPAHREMDSDSGIRMIPCATKLRRAGIKCKSNIGSKNSNLRTRMITKLCQVIRCKCNTGESPSKNSFLDIKWRRHGVIEMPTISMDDITIYFLLNCVAYEQCHKTPPKHAYFTTYAAFMDCLINTPEDVGLLCDDQVIENWLGGDAEVAQFFNKSTRDVTYDFRNGYLSKVFDDINEYYRTCCNVCWATFRHKYFDSPWSFLSLVAAVLLLVLTISQTFFAGYDYYQSRKG